MYVVRMHKSMKRDEEEEEEEKTKMNSHSYEKQ